MCYKKKYVSDMGRICLKIIHLFHIKNLKIIKFILLTNLCGEKNVPKNPVKRACQSNLCHAQMRRILCRWFIIRLAYTMFLIRQVNIIIQVELQKSKDM